MSSITQPTTFLDLYTELMNRAREETSHSPTIVQAKRYTNIALHDMHIGQGEKFIWAERSSVLVTQPKYTTGTVTITQGSTTLTGDSTAWTTTNAFGLANARVGGKVVINGGVEVYEVTAVGGATSITIGNAFIQDDVAAVNYVYFEDEYALAADFLRPIDQQKFDTSSSIDLLGRTEFRRRFPRNHIPRRAASVGTIIDKPFSSPDSGGITAFANAGTNRTSVTAASHGQTDGARLTISGTTNYNGDWTIHNVSAGGFGITTPFIADDATGLWRVQSTRQRRIRLAPPPDTADAIPYAYVTENLAVTNLGVEQPNLESDQDEPLVPIRYRQAIIWHALASWYRDKKDDARSQQALSDYTGLMVRIISDTEIGGATPQFRPRVGTYRRRAKTPWRGGTGRYDLNGKFDRLEW